MDSVSQGKAGRVAVKNLVQALKQGDASAPIHLKMAHDILGHKCPYQATFSAFDDGSPRVHDLRIGDERFERWYITEHCNCGGENQAYSIRLLLAVCELWLETEGEYPRKSESPMTSPKPTPDDASSDSVYTFTDDGWRKLSPDKKRQIGNSLKAARESWNIKNPGQTKAAFCVSVSLSLREYDKIVRHTYK